MNTACLGNGVKTEGPQGSLTLASCLTWGLISHTFIKSSAHNAIFQATVAVNISSRFHGKSAVEALIAFCQSAFCHLINCTALVVVPDCLSV